MAKKAGTTKAGTRKARARKARAKKARTKAARAAVSSMPRGAMGWTYDPLMHLQEIEPQEEVMLTEGVEPDTGIVMSAAEARELLEGLSPQEIEDRDVWVEELVDLEEASRTLGGVPARTIEGLVDDNELRAVEVSGRLLICKDELTDYVLGLL